VPALASRIWSRLRPYRKRIVRALTPGVLAMWLVIMFLSYLIGIGVGAVQSYLLENIGQAFVRDIRGELFSKFESQPLAYHRDRSTGELVTRITSDIFQRARAAATRIMELLDETTEITESESA
jgi:ABC-type multidrug transport system fused ATPase/permease subunit